jgi:hypothetical protein
MQEKVKQIYKREIREKMMNKVVNVHLDRIDKVIKE